MFPRGLSTESAMINGDTADLRVSQKIARRHGGVDFSEWAGVHDTSRESVADSRAMPTYGTRRRHACAEHRTGPRTGHAVTHAHQGGRKTAPNASTPSADSTRNCLRIAEMIATTPISHRNRHLQATTIRRLSRPGLLVARCHLGGKRVSRDETRAYGEATAKSRHSPGTPLSS